MKRTIKAPSASRWLARIVSLGVFTYVWHSFTSTYDLAELTGTMDFRFGCFVPCFPVLFRKPENVILRHQHHPGSRVLPGGRTRPAPGIPW